MTQASSPLPFPSELTVEDVADMLDAGESFRLIDVREPWERAIVSLPQAEALTDALAEELIQSAERTQPLVFICHHGIRSLNAAAYFAAQGFTSAYSMRGGIDAWAQRIDPELPRY